MSLTLYWRMLGIGRMRVILQMSRADLVAFVSTSLLILLIGFDGSWRLLLVAPKLLGLIGWCLSLIRVPRVSENLLLFHAPVEAIKFFLKDLFACSEVRFMDNGVDGFLLDVYQDLLGFRFY